MSQVRSIAALIIPFLVVILLPFWILDNYSNTSLGIFAQVLGALLFASGFLLAGWCMLLFFNVGKGTIMLLVAAKRLARDRLRDPTRKLITVGPYQYARNPMILGVLTMLVGEALFFGSAAIGIRAAVFFAINHVYFIVSEEPGLEKRFGESHREYKKRVAPLDVEATG